MFVKLRDPLFDLAKFVAIFMVVFGHVTAYASAGKCVGSTVSWLESARVLCNMPLFFIISGYFSRRFVQDGDWRGLGRRLVAYIWPMASMGLVGVLLKFSIGRSLTAVPADATDINWLQYFILIGWFFWCLVQCVVIAFVASWLSRGHAVLRGILLGAAWVALWVIPLGLYHVVSMLPFFLFGMFCLPRIFAWEKWSRWGLVLLGLYLAFCGWIGNVDSYGLSFYTTRMPLLNFTWKGFGLMFARFGLGIVGSIGVLAFLRVALRLFPKLGVMSSLGTTSLGVFFIHAFLINAYYIYGGTVSGFLPRFMIAIAVFVISHLIVLLSKRALLVEGLIWNPLLILKRTMK